MDFKHNFEKVKFLVGFYPPPLKLKKCNFLAAKEQL